MHRSGTSLVAGLLQMCGIDFGPEDRLMKPKPDNPKGFWEHLDLHRINQEILDRLGVSWQEPFRLEPGWENRSELESFYRRAHEIVERDFGESELWAFKDPRTSILIPFWRRVVPGLRFLICVRNPLDVAGSLDRRDGFATEKATNLWAFYMASALVATAGRDRLLATPESCLVDWRNQLGAILSFLVLPERRLERVAGELESFIDTRQWHHRSSTRDVLEVPSVAASCRSLYPALREFAESAQTDREAEMRLDALAELTLSEVVSHTLLENAESRLAGIDAELGRVQRRLEETGDRYFEQVTRCTNLERWLEEREGDIDRQAIEINQLRSSLRDSSAVVESITSSLGWHLIDRVRRVKNRLTSTGSLPARWYRTRTEALRQKLSPGASTVDAPTASPVEPRETRAQPTDPLEGPSRPELAVGVTRPPAHWLGEAGRPPVVVIIPNWNLVRLLRRCLASLFENTRYERMRVCVIDQDSRDGSAEYLRSLGDRIEWISSPTNLGFVHANNIAVEAFPGWDVVFLNNDTSVTSGWLSRLVETAYSAENIGLVGAKLVYPDGRLQEAGSELFRDGSARAHGRLEAAGEPEFNQRREVDFCSGACLYVKRSVLDECGGGFDELFSPCYYEDADLALKARRAGYRTIYEPHCTVVHHEHGTLGQSRAAEFMDRHREQFCERWREELGSRPRSIWTAPSRGREKVLVLGDIVPAPDRSAGGARLYHLLTILAAHYDVAYAYLQDQMIAEYIRPLERQGVHTFYPGYARAVDNYELDVEAILRDNDYEIVICSLYEVGSQFVGLVRKISPRSIVVTDTYDVHFLRELRAARLSEDPIEEQRARRTKTLELEVYSRSDAVITVTEEDRDALHAELPQVEIGIVPTIHPIPARLPERETRRDLLFVGGFSHRPNVDAIVYFCEKVMPLIVEAKPELRLQVVGNSPTPEVLALASGNVRVLGYVPHLEPLLRGALVSVAPIRFGSGMNGKIAEAMAWGLPVVTTAIGAEGLGLRHRFDAWIADDAVETARGVLELVEDDALWRRIAGNARERAAAEWTPDVVEPRVLDFLRSLPHPQL